MDDSTDAEFYADFGDALTDAELEALLARARAAGDRELRLLVKQYRGLRRATRWLLTGLDAARVPVALRDGPAARLARVLAGAETRPA